MAAGLSLVEDGDVGGVMTGIMAVFFLWLGVVCLHRPQNVQQVLTRFYQSNWPSTPVPEWLNGRGVSVFTRLIGLMSLVNFMMLFYLLLNPDAAPQ